MRSVSKLFAMVVMLWVGVVAALVGCDRHLAPDDPISPRADLKLTTLQLTNGEILAPNVATTSGGTGNVTASTADFPQVNVRLQIFNGISVQLLDYRVDYFQQDGVTPLGIGSFGGLLTTFVNGGVIGLHQTTSISPDVDPRGVLEGGDKTNPNGTPGQVDILLKIVSDELRSFLAGPNGKFRTSTEDNTDTDDFRGLVVCQVKIRGVDINSNKIEIITRLTASATVPIAGTTTGP